MGLHNFLRILYHLGLGLSLIFNLVLSMRRSSLPSLILLSTIRLSLLRICPTEALFLLNTAFSKFFSSTRSN